MMMLATVLPVAVRAEERSLRAIARAGMPAPGDSGNFLNFGQLNGVDPNISGQNIVFGASTEQSGGIYAYIDGSLRVIADTQTKFPGSGNPMGFDLSDGSSPSISGRNVAFACRDGQPGPGGICTSIDGVLGVVAMSGVTRVPGRQETFGTFFMLNGGGPAISGENVAFAAGSDSTNGIYAMINGLLRVIAERDMPVPGQEGVTFQNFGQLEGTSPSISGENVTFAGKWSGGAGVYAHINGELRFIADSTTTGGLFGLTGGGPSISGENVVFLGSSGVYAYINGKLGVIADSDTPAPGSTGTFGDFSVSPSISGENVGFGAGATGIGDAIFAYIDGALQVIASRNTPVPGNKKTTFSNFFLVDQEDFVGEGVRPAISGENVVFTASPNGVYALLPDPPPIPTVSAWWLIVLTILLLFAATTILRRRVAARAFP